MAGPLAALAALALPLLAQNTVAGPIENACMRADRGNDHDVDVWFDDRAAAIA